MGVVGSFIYLSLSIGFSYFPVALKAQLLFFSYQVALHMMTMFLKEKEKLWNIRKYAAKEENKKVKKKM